MIKFFRHIRKAMIKDLPDGKAGNKFSKYLLYAIGEIILVIIGILIALQINTWKGDVEIETFKKSQLQSLKEDLTDDLRALHEADSAARIDVQKILAINNRLQHQFSTIDTLIKIARFEFTPGITSFVGFKTATYESLISSGEIRVFNESFRKELSELSILQRRSLNTIDDHFKSYLEIVQNHLAKYPGAIGGNQIYPLSNGPLNKRLWNSKNDDELLSSFNKTIGVRLLYLSQFLGSLDDVASKTKFILETYFND